MNMKMSPTYEGVKIPVIIHKHTNKHTHQARPIPIFIILSLATTYTHTYKHIDKNDLTSLLFSLSPLSHRPSHHTAAVILYVTLTIKITIQST